MSFFRASPNTGAFKFNSDFMVNWEPVSSSLGFIKEFVHLNIMFYHQLLGSVVETFVKKLCTRSGKKTSVGPLTQPIPRKKKKKKQPRPEELHCSTRATVCWPSGYVIRHVYLLKLAVTQFTGAGLGQVQLFACSSFLFVVSSRAFSLRVQCSEALTKLFAGGMTGFQLLQHILLAGGILQELYVCLLWQPQIVK